MSLGETIYKLRTEKQLSQGDLADMLVKGVEKGNSSATINTPESEKRESGFQPNRRSQ